MRSLRNAALAAMSAFMLTGCPDEPYCGDGSCDPGEYSWCRTDCGTPDPDPDPGPGPGPGPTSCGDRSPSPTGVQLPTGNIQQWCSQWCWAAVITNVAHFYGLQASECTLASYYLGDPSLTACCQYAACAYEQCNHPATNYDMSALLLAVGLTGRYEQRALTEFEIQTELTNGRPIVGLFHGSQIGHFAAISGYTAGSPAVYTVDDPWPYNGTSSTRFFLTYAQLLAGPNGSSPWNHSWFRISTRADGCNPGWDPSCGCDGPDPDPGPGPEPEPTCSEPYPVDCGDGTGCWSQGTDCANNVFTCNGQWRCANGSDAASCCGGNFITCPSAYPYPCPSDGLCYSAPNACTSSACSWSGIPCR